MSKKQTDDAAHLDDAAQLAALGYTSEFKREMGLWGNIAVGFTYLSPIVGVYALFSTSLATAGPPMLWAFIIVGVGQFLVALVFGEIVSQFPVAGGVYPWARRLWGRRWAWMTGWIYMIALFSSIGGIAYSAAPYVSSMLGHNQTVNYAVVAALVLLGVSTIINFGGTKVLSVAVTTGFITGLVGAIGVGAWLLIKSDHDFSVFFDAMGSADGKTYFFAFAAAGLVAVFQYYGFEACGDLAEEVPNPGVQVPKAMRMTIYIGGFAATFTALTMIMAVVPNIQQVIASGGACAAGQDGVCAADALDPVSYALNQAFGSADKIVLLIVVLSFLSCLVSLQAAASRLVFSYSRDQMIMGHKVLRVFWKSRHVPPFALVVAAGVPALVVFVASRLSDNAVWSVIGFAAIGIYLGFQSVVLAALRARLKGWKPSGKFRLGKWGLAVNIGALTWGVCGILVIAWPWDIGSGKAWYDVWLVLLSAVVVIGGGLFYMLTARPYQYSDTPAGDAIPQRPDAAATTDSVAGATPDASATAGASSTADPSPDETS
jgi:amino acid transporter